MSNTMQKTAQQGDAVLFFANDLTLIGCTEVPLGEELARGAIDALVQRVLDSDPADMWRYTIVTDGKILTAYQIRLIADAFGIK
ncbi:hypothetical protein WBP06_20310 [Novosphingobium sp. BL-8H]|uniref:hypothetical protein n=1 Tax=Novosphingobium sp. BL-8H TaxID=3127640 RepID=UPI00375721C1